MQLSSTTDASPGALTGLQRARKILGRELVAWSVIALIALAAVFVQSCPDHARAEPIAEAVWSPTSAAWAAVFSCPAHQAFFVPSGDLQGS